MLLNNYKYVTIVQGKKEILNRLVFRIRETENMPQEVIKHPHCDAVRVPESIIKYLSKVIDIKLRRSLGNSNCAVYAVYSANKLSKKDFLFWIKSEEHEDLFVHSCSVLNIRRITARAHSSCQCLFCNNRVHFELDLIPIDEDAYAFEVESMDTPWDVRVGLQEVALTWLSEEGDVRYNPVCDIGLPADTYIDWMDFAILADNWLAGK